MCLLGRRVGWVRQGEAPTISQATAAHLWDLQPPQLLGGFCVPVTSAVVFLDRPTLAHLMAT